MQDGNGTTIVYIDFSKVFGSSLSNEAELISGIVQGSGIGPLMFLVYINELVQSLEEHDINLKVKLFADDVKMYVKLLDNHDLEKLRGALNSLVKWSDTWQLTISIEKCYVLNIESTQNYAYLYISNDTSCRSGQRSRRYSES